MRDSDRAPRRRAHRKRRRRHRLPHPLTTCHPGEGGKGPGRACAYLGGGRRGGGRGGAVAVLEILAVAAAVHV